MARVCKEISTLCQSGSSLAGSLRSSVSHRSAPASSLAFISASNQRLKSASSSMSIKSMGLPSVIPLPTHSPVLLSSSATPHLRLTGKKWTVKNSEPQKFRKIFYPKIFYQPSASVIPLPVHSSVLLSPSTTTHLRLTGKKWTVKNSEPQKFRKIFHPKIFYQPSATVIPLPKHSSVLLSPSATTHLRLTGKKWTVKNSEPQKFRKIFYPKIFYQPSASVIPLPVHSSVLLSPSTTTHLRLTGKKWTVKNSEPQKFRKIFHPKIFYQPSASVIPLPIHSSVLLSPSATPQPILHRPRPSPPRFQF